MNQRRTFLGHCGLLGVLLVPSVAMAQASNPVAGTDYIALKVPVPVDTPHGKIELLEFFWYNCGHCRALEPVLADWRKKLPKDVVFKRVPVAFRDDFVPQQRLYYALDAMGLVEKLHTRVFDAIFVEKRNLTRGDVITDWVVGQGVDKTKFLESFNAFSTSAQAGRARQLQTAYKVDGVPALGIAGRFYTDGALARSMDKVLQVAEYLMAEVRRGH